MKKSALLLLVFLTCAGSVFAEDQLRNVQTELKSLGFYYGDVTGQPNAETAAAIRRYQIRNGLEVTGSLNQETLGAMKIGRAPAASVAETPTKPASKTAPVAGQKPPINLRRTPTAEESDRDFLRREESRSAVPDAVSPLAPAPPTAPSRDPSVINAPEPLDAPSPDFPVLFAGTPYADAPLSVQQKTLRKAQSLLAGRGYYRDIVDGLPGPATEEAVLTFQRASRLTLTGRLDLDTLAELRLLPKDGTYSDAGGFRAPKRTYRGIWIDRGGLRFGIEFD